MKVRNMVQVDKFLVAHTYTLDVEDLLIDAKSKIKEYIETQDLKN